MIALICNSSLLFVTTVTNTGCCQRLVKEVIVINFNESHHKNVVTVGFEPTPSK